MLVLGFACGGESPPPAAAAAPVVDAGPPDPLAEKHWHCPVTVAGATTDLNDVEGGVELVIRVSSDAGHAELMKRAHHLEDFAQNSGNVMHRGGKRGGGWMTECPVVVKNTLVEATETPEGARIRVSVEDASNVDALRIESRRRLAVLRARRR